MKKPQLAILLLSVFLFASTWAQGVPVVSDSLVQDLACPQLSIKEIHRKIRPEAFQTSYHLPVRNWSFSSGLYDLAACWSLARSQRLFFYLSRWNEKAPPADSKIIFNLLEMIRGSSPYTSIDEQQIKEFPLKELYVTSQPESSLGPQSPLWASLLVGLKQTLENDRVLFRNLRTEVEFYQSRRFHDFIRNIRYVIGDGARSPRKNRATRDLIIRNLEENSLPLILLRPKRVSQHVVLAKRYTVLSNGDIEFEVYDSNQPSRDQRLLFSHQEDEFYGPDIVGGLPKVDDPQAPLGVFVVDEKERDLIDRALLKYYQKKCP